ncbi:MAG: hypothetical protein WD738_19325 [Pirellulales bacterium]
MSAVNRCQKTRQDLWQDGFVKMLPQIRRLLRHVFADLNAEKREEAIQNAIVICLVSYARLHARGRAKVVSASNLVWYAVLQVKSGRVAGGHLNGRDPLSLYAQLRRGIKVQRLHTYNAKSDAWIDTIVEDKRAPIPDVVATKLDFLAWLATLCHRTRRIACDLAKGYSTAETAGKYGVSPGRISQIRRELAKSWSEFQHESVLNLAG